MAFLLATVRIEIFVYSPCSGHFALDVNVINMSIIPSIGAQGVDNDAGRTTQGNSDLPFMPHFGPRSDPARVKNSNLARGAPSRATRHCPPRLTGYAASWFVLLELAALKVGAMG